MERAIWTPEERESFTDLRGLVTPEGLTTPEGETVTELNRQYQEALEKYCNAPDHRREQKAKLGVHAGKLFVKIHRLLATDKEYQEILKQRSREDWRIASFMMGDSEGAEHIAGFKAEFSMAQMLANDLDGQVYFPEENEDMQGVDWWVNLIRKSKKNGQYLSHAIALQVKSAPIDTEILNHIIYPIRNTEEVDELGKILYTDGVLPPNSRGQLWEKVKGSAIGMQRLTYLNVSYGLALLPSGRGYQSSYLDPTTGLLLPNKREIVLAKLMQDILALDNDPSKRVPVKNIN